MALTYNQMKSISNKIDNLNYEDVRNTGQIIGDLYNNISGTTSNNQFNAERAEIEHNWAIEDQLNYYQRSMEGLKKAGLNPALMYQSGQIGAPMTNTAQARATTNSGIASIISSAVSLAIGLKHTTKGNAAAETALKLIEQHNSQVHYHYGEKKYYQK